MSVLDDSNTILDKGVEKTLEEHMKTFMDDYMQSPEFKWGAMQAAQDYISYLERRIDTLQTIINDLQSVLDKHSHDIQFHRDQQGHIINAWLVKNQ